MKFLLLLFAVLVSSPARTHADVENSLGKSPDGRFELILTAVSKNDYGRVIVRDLTNGNSVETESGQGYGYFPSGDVTAIWRDSSDAFAVTMRGTKRTWNTDVYIRDGEAWQKLDFPPYVANILGRQGVIQSGRSFREAFGGFGRDNRFTLLSHIEPDWHQQQVAKETDWKPTTHTEWKIVIEFFHRMRPNCHIVCIEPLKKDSEEQGREDQLPIASKPKPADGAKPDSEPGGRAP
ncbi:MAG: hypothetical protein R3F11_06095 [Verrucomicrobiales bacterium]